jgi:hypothetical protein
VRVQGAEHSGDRRFGHLVEINLSGVMVLCDEDRLAKVIGDSRSGRKVGGALTERARYALSKGEWQYERQHQQPVSL